MTDQQSLADEICTKYTRTTTLSGTLPRYLTKTTLARIQNKDLSPGAEAETHGGEAGSVSYNCLAQVGYDVITDEHKHDIEVYGRDAIEDHLGVAIATSNLNIDDKLREVLESTSLNGEESVGNAWDDGGSSSTPWEDMRDGIQSKAPGADTIVCGIDVAQALMSNSNFYAQTSYFNAGTSNLDALAEDLKANLKGIQNVYLPRKIYDSANRGQNTSVDYLMKSTFWIGHKRNLIMVDPQGEINNKTEISRAARRRSDEIVFTRYVDIIRPDSLLGVTFTGTLT
jgi:hypothetical protein